MYNTKNKLADNDINISNGFIVSTCLRYEKYVFNNMVNSHTSKLCHLEGKIAATRLIRLMIGEYSELEGEIEIRNQIEKGIINAYELGNMDYDTLKCIEKFTDFADSLRQKYHLAIEDNYSTIAYRVFKSKWNKDDLKCIMIIGDGYMAQSFYNAAKNEYNKFISVNRDVNKAKSIFKHDDISGGGFWQAVAAFTGGVLIGVAPVIGVAVGIVTPVAKGCAGVAVWSAVTYAGTACLDYASK